MTAPVAVSAPDHRECIGSRRSWSLGGWQPLPYRIIEGLLVNRSQRADESQYCRRVCRLWERIGRKNEPTR